MPNNHNNVALNRFGAQEGRLMVAAALKLLAVVVGACGLLVGIMSSESAQKAVGLTVLVLGVSAFAIMACARKGPAEEMGEEV